MLVVIDIDVCESGLVDELIIDPFNDALALTIYCDNQLEIDAYWDYFTLHGKEVQFGWCIDKFGLRWQVIPQNFNELMSKPNSWEVMMKQKKIIIKEYLK